jgi:polyisoprenoid-binding protein YceI
MKMIMTLILAVTTSVAMAETKLETKVKSAAKKVEKAVENVVLAKKMEVTGVVKWTGYGVGKSHHGEIAIKSGEIEMKGDELTGGNFVLDMPTLKTADSARLQSHLRSEDFFDVEKNKESTYKITKVEALPSPKAGEPTHKITGDLTIKGKTGSETLLATIVKKDNKYSAVAKGTIADRTKYDIVYNSAKFKTASALGDKLIEDKIDVEIDAQTK